MAEREIASHGTFDQAPRRATTAAPRRSGPGEGGDAAQVGKNGEAQLTRRSSSLEDTSCGTKYLQALVLTIIFITMAALFAFPVYYWSGKRKEVVVEYFTAYLVEMSLSVDNLFVFYLIFKYYKTPERCQTRVLFIGWIIALLLRGTMIFAVGESVEHIKYILLLFALVLLFQAYQTLFGGDDDDDEDLSNNSIVKFARRVMCCCGVGDTYYGTNFFVRDPDGRLVATPLVLVMITSEFSDIVFAVDSVPAVFGVTKNMLVAYSSNMFALLALRSMYIVLAHVIVDFPELQISIGLVLAFVGVKIICNLWIKEPDNIVSLFVVGMTLLLGIFAGIMRKNEVCREGFCCDRDEEEEEGGGRRRGGSVLGGCRRRRRQASQERRRGAEKGGQQKRRRRIVLREKSAANKGGRRHASVTARRHSAAPMRVTEEGEGDDLGIYIW